MRRAMIPHAIDETRHDTAVDARSGPTLLRTQPRAEKRGRHNCGWCMARMLAHASATQPLPKKRSVAETFGECARRRAVSNAAHRGPYGTVFRRGRSYTPPR